MEGRVIPEPQRTYLLELLDALGPAADDFVVAGAQAMKFVVDNARGTKDVDFLLNVLALRKEPVQLAPIFEKLGYAPVPESRNFQFEKAIPRGTEKMRVESMAPEEYNREKDFRVDIQEGVHARACTGGSIALAQYDLHTIAGKLPSGGPCTTQVRVTQPHALVMLKLLALADRYNNLRGPKEARHTAKRHKRMPRISSVSSGRYRTSESSTTNSLLSSSLSRSSGFMHSCRLLS